MSQNYDDLLAGNDLSDSLDHIRNRDDALQTLFAGPNEPLAPAAYQLWADTTNAILKQRNAANSAWLNIWVLGDTEGGLVKRTAGSLLSNLDANNNRVQNLLDPIASLDAANKQYVDQNRPGQYIFSGGSTGGYGVGNHNMEFDTPDLNVGFTLQNSDTELVFTNAGWYDISLLHNKNGGGGTTATLQRIESGPTYVDVLENIHNGASDETSSSRRLLEVQAGDVFRIRLNVGGGSAVGGGRDELGFEAIWMRSL